jgi:hypothetical protein
MSINGNGVIWRSALIDGDDVSFADDKAGGFPELNKYHVNLQTIFSIARRTPIWYVIFGVNVIH